MPSRDVRIVLDMHNLRSLTFGEGMSTMLYQKAQAVSAAAKSRAPVKSGRYISSFAIAFATTDRNVIRVHNNAPWALTVEYGGSSTGKSRPLGSGLEAAGLADVHLSGSRKQAKAKRTRAINKKTGTSARQRARLKRLRKKHGRT